MQLFNPFRMAQDPRLGAIPECHRMVAEALPAVVLFTGLQRINERAHRTVEDEDTLIKQLIDSTADVAAGRRTHESGFLGSEDRVCEGARCELALPMSLVYAAAFRNGGTK